MSNKLPRLLLILFLVTAVLFSGAALTGCGPKDEEDKPAKEQAAEPAQEQAADPELIEVPVEHDEQFGGIFVKTPIEEFNKTGFALGDSVDIDFSNGYMLHDLPYYSGCYVQPGDALLAGYPGYDYIEVSVSCGDDLWDTAGLKENDTADITLREKGKYLEIQKAGDITYEDSRDAFESDVIFANFRALEAGSLKKNQVFRSASPCDNTRGRASCADDLIEKAGVRYIINLADSEEKISGFTNADDFDSPYFASLYKEGDVALLAVDMNYKSVAFRDQLIQGLRAMADHRGPYLIHSLEGKDRTGFVCMMLEALAGASYDEIVDDYMITYDNYYGINKTSDPGRYKTIKENNIDPMLRFLAGDMADMESADLARCAVNYLRNSGMDDDEIEKLKSRIMNESSE